MKSMSRNIELSKSFMVMLIMVLFLDIAFLIYLACFDVFNWADNIQSVKYIMRAKVIFLLIISVFLIFMAYMIDCDSRKKQKSEEQVC